MNRIGHKLSKTTCKYRSVFMWRCWGNSNNSEFNLAGMTHEMMKRGGGQSAEQTYCSFNYALGSLLMKLFSIMHTGKEITRWCAPQMELHRLWNSSLALAQVFSFVFGRKPTAGRCRDDQPHLLCRMREGACVVVPTPVLPMHFVFDLKPLKQVLIWFRIKLWAEGLLSRHLSVYLHL